MTTKEAVHRCFSTFSRKQSVPESYFFINKVAGLQLQPTLIKKVLQGWCFPGSYTIFLTRTFLTLKKL